MIHFWSSSAGLDFFWLGIAGRTRLGFRGSPDRPGKRELSKWLWECPLFWDLEVGAGGRITAPVLKEFKGRDLNFLAPWDGSWTRGKRKRERVHRKWKAWHFYKEVCYFLWTVVCFVLCVHKPAFEKHDQNMSKKLLKPSRAGLQLKKTTPVLSNIHCVWWSVGLGKFKGLLLISRESIFVWRRLGLFEEISTRHFFIKNHRLTEAEMFHGTILFLTKPLWEDAVLPRVYSDQNLRKMKWENLGHCVWVALDTVNHKDRSTCALQAPGHKSSPLPRSTLRPTLKQKSHSSCMSHVCQQSCKKLWIYIILNLHLPLSSVTLCFKVDTVLYLL